MKLGREAKPHEITKEQQEKIQDIGEKIMYKYRKDLNTMIKDRSKFNILLSETLKVDNTKGFDINTSDLNNLFIDKCIIDTGSMRDILFINDDDYFILFSLVVGTFTFIEKTNIDLYYHLPLSEPKDPDSFLDAADIAKSLGIGFLALFNRLANQEKDVIKTTRKVIGKKKNRPVYQNYYSVDLDNIKRYDYGPDYTPIRKNQRHIDSWDVRGHERKLKSGKVIWIKPSVRGNRNKESKKQTYECKGE